MKRKQLTKKELTEVCAGLYRNSNASVRISVYGKRDVRLIFEGITGNYEIMGTSISDCLKKYNSI